LFAPRSFAHITTRNDIAIVDLVSGKGLRAFTRLGKAGFCVPAVFVLHSQFLPEEAQPARVAEVPMKNASA
jgi:hypothetical protein